jgi:CheY-like chemotaxis protein/ribonuclease BN (tRNA processing enzyme)
MTENKTDILIIDDDPIASKLTETLLTSADLKVSILKDPADTLVTVRKKEPRAVILDLMLNNLNGIEIIKLIKSDKSLKDTKIIVVTEKFYDFEKKQAFKYGAASFLKKPYNVETFAGQIKNILSEKPNTALEEKIEEEKKTMINDQDMEKSSLESGQVCVTVWGLRNMPDQLPVNSSYVGRQTSCVSIETDDDLIIFDAGTGIIPLGRQIMERHGPKNIWILLTNFHIGNIWGLANFAPLYQKGYSIKISGPGQSDKKLKSIVTGILYDSPYWDNKMPKAEISMYEMGPDIYELNDKVKVIPMQSNYPSNTLCYRLETAGKSIVYAPNSEISQETTAVEKYQERLKDFAQDADILIHDTAYTHDDYLLNIGKGHSCDKSVLEFAAKAKVKNLLMFNFNGNYPDETIETVLKKAQKIIISRGLDINCHNVKEGFLLIV